MFLSRFITTSRRDKRRGKRIDVVTEQVKKVLTDSDQRIILMVRG